MNTALISVCSEFTEFDIVDDDTAAIVSNMVVLAGMDAVVATHRDSSDPAAETGRPETSKEFAQRMRGKFVLRGPCERTEGENGSKLPITSENWGEIRYSNMSFMNPSQYYIT